jgi:transcriptional regulator with XRE-family HTH domain
MDKKIGQIIKEVADIRNVKVIAFAKAIGVTRNNIYAIYERESIDTELLKKIGQYLNYDFFQHFIEPETLKKIKMSENLKTSKVLVEIELNEDEMMKIGFEEKVLKILNR